VAAFSSSSSMMFRQAASPSSRHHHHHVHLIAARQTNASSILDRRNIIFTQQMMMSFFGDQSEGSGGIQRIDKTAMAEIIEDVVNSSREESGYIIIDVRGHDEVQYTGKLDDVVVTLPLPYIAQGALAMEEEEFQDAFGFEKPQLDETLVFTCKAGIRSYQAAQLAKMAGYSNILDYMGGSNEWFSS
jgi:rhodanese-related sulfurtransferase